MRFIFKFLAKALLLLILFCGSVFVYTVQTWERPCPVPSTPGNDHPCGER